jgi:hypothetical protein
MLRIDILRLINFLQCGNVSRHVRVQFCIIRLPSKGLFSSTVYIKLDTKFGPGSRFLRTRDKYSKTARGCIIIRITGGNTHH